MGWGCILIGWIVASAAGPALAQEAQPTFVLQEERRGVAVNFDVAEAGLAGDFYEGISHYSLGPDGELLDQSRVANRSAIPVAADDGGWWLGPTRYVEGTVVASVDIPGTAVLAEASTRADGTHVVALASRTPDFASHLTVATLAPGTTTPSVALQVALDEVTYAIALDEAGNDLIVADDGRLRNWRWNNGSFEPGTTIWLNPFYDSWQAPKAIEVDDGTMLAEAYESATGTLGIIRYERTDFGWDRVGMLTMARRGLEEYEDGVVVARNSGDPLIVFLTADGEGFSQPLPARPRTSAELAGTRLYVGNDATFQRYELASSGCTIEGTASDDRLVGTAGNDVICGLGGNDILIGGGGDDVLMGGDGNDDLFGGSGNDELVGGPGDDDIRGDSGDDVIRGGEGNDRLGGWWGHDRIEGGPGDDRVVGGEGNDLIFGADGNDTLSGEAGNDRVFGDAGNDTLDGGDGADRLGGGAGTDTISGDDGNDTLWAGPAATTAERLDGGAGTDACSGGFQVGCD